MPENSESFNGIAEMFLAAHLGGACEQGGEDFKGAEFEVRVGAALSQGWKAQWARWREPAACRVQTAIGMP